MTTLSTREAEMLAWAYHTLSVVFGPTKPKHVREHLEVIDGMIRSHANQEAMKADLLKVNENKTRLAFQDTVAAFKEVDLPV